MYNFPKSICPKVNVIAWREFDFTYNDLAVYHFNYYITKTSCGDSFDFFLFTVYFWTILSDY